MRYTGGFLIVVLSSFFIFSSSVYARPDAVIYEESISIDENGDPLSFPSFVYVDRFTQEIYIIDGRGRIIIYSPDLIPILTLNKKHGITAPQGLALDRDGNMYIGLGPSSEDPRARIAVYSPCLIHERDIYLEDFENGKEFIPHRLAIDSKGNIIVVANLYPGAVILSNDGKIIDIISPLENGKKVKLTSVVVDSRDNIYLLSEEQGRVYVYNSDRKPLFAFGEKGGSSGKLSRPRGMAIDESGGRMYIVDYMRHTVTVYDQKGKYLFEFGGLGFDPGWFWFPNYISVDKEGRLYVADYFNHRIQVFITRGIR